MIISGKSGKNVRRIRKTNHDVSAYRHASISIIREKIMKKRGIRTNRPLKIIPIRNPYWYTPGSLHGYLSLLIE
jgi:hypothetical protein